MKAYVLKRHGKPAVLQMTEVSEPEPKTGEVKVAVRAIGINYAEVMSRKGIYGWAPRRPYILGMEACGVIESVGEGVSQKRVGEKVMVGAQHGAYAEKMVADERQAIALPRGFSFEEGAALMVNFLTAWVALFECARLSAKESLFISAAAGGVGSAAVMLAKKNKSRVYGAAGGPEKIKYLKNLGVDLAIDYRKDDFTRPVIAATGGRGVDVVLETVGGDVFRQSLDLMAPFAKIVVVGYASLKLQKWNPLTWYGAWKNAPKVNVSNFMKKTHGFYATHIGYLLKDKETLEPVKEKMLQYIKKHKIKPVVGKVFSFEEIPAAHEYMESRKSMGKIVIHLP